MQVGPFGAMRIVESPFLTVSGAPVRVPRSWRDRLLSWPWRPWVATRTHIPQVPDPNGYRMGNQIVMHPQTARRLAEMLAKEQE